VTTGDGITIAVTAGAETLPSYTRLVVRVIPKEDTEAYNWFSEVLKETGSNILPLDIYFEKDGQIIPINKKMDRYKSWSGLKKQLSEGLCDELKNRITFFLTRYHSVHNSYGRAAIRLDGKELVIFSWIDMYYQQYDMSELYKSGVRKPYDELEKLLKPKWDSNCTYSDMDFLDAALQFRNMSIKDALESENYIIKILAILDKRIGKRTLRAIKERNEYTQYPAWVQQFYQLRLATSNL
ncbi:MAG: hypothetical protein WBI55_06005, partial [Eubacteriales bacterium]